MDITTKNTSELKGYFQTGAIPTEEHYAFLIDAGLNQADMGVARTTGEPLSIQAEGIPTGPQAVLQFFTHFSDAAPKWGLNMNPSGGTAGLNIHDVTGSSRFFIKESDGNIGLGTMNPTAELEVSGQIKMTGGSPGVGKILTSDAEGLASWGEAPGARWEKNNDDTAYYTAGHIGIGTTAPADLLDVNGNLVVRGNLTVEGDQLITNTQTVEVEDNIMLLNRGESGAGISSGEAGLEFDRGTNTNYKLIFDEGSDSLKAGETGSLKSLALREDSPDDTGLTFWNDNTQSFDTDATLVYSSGNLGIGTASPQAKLDIGGNLAIAGTEVINNAGEWVGSPTGLQGTQGETGPEGPAGPQGPEGASPFLLSGANAYYTAGNVGIATTTPQAELQIGDDTGDRELRIGGAGKFRALSHNTGSVWFQAGTEWTGGSATDMIFSGIYGNPIHMAIQSDGNIGIGTSAPTAKLEIAGQVKITGGTPGAGKVLTSDATGLATWQTPSGGSGGGLWTSGASNAIHYTSGKVGIGTTDPERFLHVRGDVIRLDRDASAPGFQITRWSSGYGTLWKTFGFLVDASSENNGKFIITDRGTTTGGAGSNPRFTIDNDGNIGIGNTAPVAKLDIMDESRTGSHPTSVKGMYITGSFGSSSDGIEFRHSNATQGIGFGYNSIYATGSNANQHLNLIPRGTGGVGIGTDVPSYKLHVNGTIRCTSLSQSSDLRLKKDIQNIDSALEKVLQLRGIHYQWNKEEFPDQDFSEGKQLGLIAQEVEDICPELVDTDAEGYKSVRYNGMVPVLIETIKELHETIEEMKTEQARLKALVDGGS